MTSMDVIALRREFHRHPEVGFTEFWTASRVVEMTQALGFEVIFGQEVMDGNARRGAPAEEEVENAYQRAVGLGANAAIAEQMKGGFTGVVAVLRGSRPGPTVAFRFDMDALPIEESKAPEHLPQSEGFRSKFDGNMHACAHDAHTAIGIALAQKMTKHDFAGTLKLIFQPAEEGGRGAFSMVDKGVVDDVSKLFCFHLGLGVPLGTIYGGSTDWMASSKLSAHFTGVPAHSGLNPEKGRNALLAAATATLNIHAIPKFSHAITSVNVGIMRGGTAINIVPHLADLVVETRASTSEVNEALEQKVRDIICHSAWMHGVQVEITKIGEAVTLHSDNRLIDTVLEEAQAIPEFTVLEKVHCAGACEDASFFVKRVQECGGSATYMVIGTTIAAPHHNDRFDIDEKALPMTVELLERIALRELRND